MRQRKIPMRMCTGCGEMKPKRELVRIVKAPEKPGEDGSPLPPCIELERTFSCKIPEEVYERLEREMAEDG